MDASPPFRCFSWFGGSVYDRHCPAGLVSWTPAPDGDARQMEQGLISTRSVQHPRRAEGITSSSMLGSQSLAASDQQHATVPRCTLERPNVCGDTETGLIQRPCRPLRCHKRWRLPCMCSIMRGFPAGGQSIETRDNHARRSCRCQQRVQEMRSIYRHSRCLGPWRLRSMVAQSPRAVPALSIRPDTAPSSLRGGRSGAPSLQRPTSLHPSSSASRSDQLTAFATAELHGHMWFCRPLYSLAHWVSASPSDCCCAANHTTALHGARLEHAAALSTPIALSFEPTAWR